MKSLIVLGLLLTGPLANADSYTCRCSGSTCGQNAKPIQFHYSPPMQVYIEGDTWTYMGYAARLHNKTLNKTYLTIPASMSFESVTVEVGPDRLIHGFIFNDENYLCEAATK